MNQALLIGKWRATDDPNEVRVFRANGTTCDDGGCGTWSWTPASSVPDLPPGTAGSGQLGNELFMKVFYPGPGSQPLYYGVPTLDNTRLELVYLGAGRILDYTRVTP